MQSDEPEHMWFGFLSLSYPNESTLVWPKSSSLCTVQVQQAKHDSVCRPRDVLWQEINEWFSASTHYIHQSSPSDCCFWSLSQHTHIKSGWILKLRWYNIHGKCLRWKGSVEFILWSDFGSHWDTRSTCYCRTFPQLRKRIIMSCVCVWQSPSINS